MLELKNIVKDYPAGSNTVQALKGVSLSFRKNEFVSILGPSGCGKTTMLNIIGGLDQYTSGDLVIGGRSTKDFRDRDWDAYRNHSVGFVFQSYNLISHQSVLANVELALSLSGVAKAERRRRAVAALERVGLGDQLKKKPNEMSGGQMQRVAIARALVNNPDIILADEPTGALDSETSIQVMELLKEIANDRLVIMVTHNPDLAEKYSTRIVRMLDGEIISDSSPLTTSELEAERGLDKDKNESRVKLPSLKWTTSFGLSLKNLFTKKGRTILTSFAGSIGIIGIALIYAVSQGMTTYINLVQEDTLSSYPLMLEAQHVDLGTLMNTFIGAAESEDEHENDAVYEKPAFYEMVNAMNSIESRKNDLKSYLEEKLAEEGEDSLADALSGVQYTYNFDLNVYTKNVDGDIIHSDMRELMQNIMIKYFGASMAMSSTGSSSMSSDMPTVFSVGSASGTWQEMLPGLDGELVNPLLEKQYDLVYGSWPTEYNEVVIVLDSNNEIADMTLYALGLIPEEDIDAIAQSAIDKTSLDYETHSWSYEEICDMDYRVILGSDCYTYDEDSGLYVDLRDTSAGLKYLYDNGIKLRVSGIIKPNEDAAASMLSGSICYTSALTEYVVERAGESDAVSAQISDPMTDIFSGLPFLDSTGDLTDAEKAADFRSYIETLSDERRAEAYIEIMSIPSDETLDAQVEAIVGPMTREDMESTLTQAMTEQTGMGESEIAEYIAAMTDDDMKEFFTEMISEQLRAQYAAGVREQLGAMTTEQLAAALDMSLESYTDEQCAVYYDEILEFSDSTYENNLSELGYVDLDDPSAINLYASSFENKDSVEEMIADYNSTVDELSMITYTDYVGLIMSSVTTIINAITYVLISFVAVSLIVSSIMIGVITLISVQERTKEIGILRAIGASKRNVSGMFNAETLIIGFTSGLLGVVITYLLCIPINIILHHLTGINSLSAYLPLPTAIILVVISVLLTLISGIIPSRSAAKKDPVVALRTE